MRIGASWKASMPVFFRRVGLVEITNCGNNTFQQLFFLPSTQLSGLIAMYYCFWHLAVLSLQDEPGPLAPCPEGFSAVIVATCFVLRSNGRF